MRGCWWGTPTTEENKRFSDSSFRVAGDAGIPGVLGFEGVASACGIAAGYLAEMVACCFGAGDGAVVVAATAGIVGTVTAGHDEGRQGEQKGSACEFHT